MNKAVEFVRQILVETRHLECHGQDDVIDVLQIESLEEISGGDELKVVGRFAEGDAVELRFRVVNCDGDYTTLLNASELAKEFAIRDFVEHIFHMLQRNGQLNRSVSIGFSDDDKGNVKTVSSYIRAELSKRFEGIKFVVYDTSDRSLPKGRKVCVSGQLNLPGF